MGGVEGRARSVPELVAPAGTPQKLLTALRFGADAVYLGLKRFSMRAAAGNFTFDELEWGIGQARAQQRKVYVTLNIQPFDDDLAGLEESLRVLAALRPDAVILADPAVLLLARQLAPALPLHLSTQASVTNAQAGLFWHSQGCRRIVVARELSLPRLAAVTAALRVAGGEAEAFVHGAVCIAFSGRCLLSLYWAGRDPRRGACAQGCRWEYREVEDGRRPGLGNPVLEDERGTHFFDAKDLCALPLLEELVATGVHALKIEGRTRSPNYLAGTVDVYRQALDLLAAGDLPGLRAARPRMQAELARCSPRPFSTHFYGGEEDLLSSYSPGGSPAAGPPEYLGEVTGGRAGEIELVLCNPVKPGDLIEVRDVGLQQTSGVVQGLVDGAGDPLAAGRPGQVVRILGSLGAAPGAIVRLAPTASQPGLSGLP